MNRHIVFLVLIGTLFGVLTVVFVAFPRSTFSELEKRDLATFPDYSHEALFAGNYSRDISAWFSDSEPYRDRFMALHMQIKDGMVLRRSGDDAVTFHAELPGAETEEDVVADDQAGERENRDIADVGQIGANAPAKVASGGIIVAGEIPEVRAMMVYKGEASGGKAWAETVNFYKKTLGSAVNVYCMVIPTPIEYYCPDKVKSRTYRQLPTIRNIYSLLDDSVRAVDVYTILGQHASEPIYFRTDHHWTPLGAYYAAMKFAEVARVPFSTIDRFDVHERQGFVGSMYGYSKDNAVRRSPETFVYYTPKDTLYSTTYRSFTLDSAFHVKSQSATYKGDFFMPNSYKGGSSYSMFMGGDAKVTVVRTSGKTGRRLLIIKDSFGNALPPFLFGSFDEVHVVDHRYFIDNLESYIRTNGVTDVVFVHNIFNAYSLGVAKNIRSILTQKPKRL